MWTYGQIEAGGSAGYGEEAAAELETKGRRDEYQQSDEENLRWRDSRKAPSRKTQEEMEL